MTMRTRERKRKARNIMETYRAATAAERVEGRSWYSTAREIAESLDPKDPSRAAAVIAVLSPQTQWSVNVNRATAAYAGLYVGGLQTNARKAARILAGENPDTVVSGPKVRAFWHAIVDPHDVRAVVIDRHAIDVAYGEVMDDKRRGAILGRKGAYDEVAQWYTWAAEFLSEEFGTEVSPVQVQATTWVAWRRMKKGFEE